MKNEKLFKQQNLLAMFKFPGGDEGGGGSGSGGSGGMGSGGGDGEGGNGKH